VQPNVYGLAGSVSGKVMLSFGAKNDIDPHPFSIVRDFGGSRSIIGSGKYIEGPIFNVGTLPNFSVIVNDVSYADIQNQGRRAAYGVDMLWQRTQGRPMFVTKVFGPAKGELR
jgi:hypothetical protein